MIEFPVEIEGLEALRGHVTHAVSQLEADLRAAALESAAAGVKAAQDDHPYQDWRDPKKSYRWRGALGLTDTSHAEQPRAGNLRTGFYAEMVWPADYAGFVNDGTSRSRPYPFTPIARERAEYALSSYVEHALANFRRALGA